MVLTIAVGMFVVGVVVGTMMSTQVSSNQKDERPTFCNYPILVLTDKSPQSDPALQLSYSTFNYRFSSNAGDALTAVRTEMVLVDGDRSRSADFDAVVKSCAKAYANGSTVAVVWYDDSFIQYVSNAYWMETYGKTYGNTTAPPVPASGQGYAAAIYQNPDNSFGASFVWDADPDKSHGTEIVTIMYEWGIRTMYGQPDIAFLP